MAYLKGGISQVICKVSVFRPHRAADMHLRIHNVFQKGEMLACHDAPNGAFLGWPMPLQNHGSDWTAPIATVVTKGSYRGVRHAPYDRRLSFNGPLFNDRGRKWQLGDCARFSMSLR